MSEVLPGARPSPEYNDRPEDERAEPRLIRRIGFGYALDYMPSPLLIGYNQMRRKLERAGFDVQVELVPLNDLPADLDALYVPQQLAQAARDAAPGTWIVELDSFLNHPAYSELVDRLAAGREICARRAAEPGSETGPVIMRYRGNVRIE